jgi:hypothetical protein
LLLLVADITVIACVPFVPDILTVAGLPAIAGIPGIVGVPALAFIGYLWLLQKAKTKYPTV